MAHMGKTGGGIGSNQYQVRGTAVQRTPRPDPQTDLMQQAGAASALTCGQVWGTKCKHMVQPPLYSHGNHPNKVERVGPDAPASAVAALADPDGPVWAVHAALNSPQCPAEALHRAMTSPKVVSNPGLVGAVAAHRNTPSDVLVAIANSNYTWAAASAIANPSINYDQIDLDQLLRRPMVADYVVDCSGCPTPVLDRLVDLGYAQQVAGRAEPLPVSIQKRLLAIEDTDPQLRVRLAARQDLHPQALRQLAQSSLDAPEVASGLAANPSCPPDVLQQIADQPTVALGTALAVAGHPNAPDEALMTMARYPSVAVRATVLSRPNCPERALEVLIRDTDPNINQEAWALYGGGHANIVALRDLIGNIDL